MVRSDPTRDITSPVNAQRKPVESDFLLVNEKNTNVEANLPKNGTDRATAREDNTRADLSIIMFGYVCRFGGSSSSKLRARGVMVSAYLVIGFVT
jgi:hypothetical protein